MSAERPYVTRVYWDNGRGFARLNGKSYQLEVVPVIDGIPHCTMLDYIPCVIALVQPFAEKVRDLEVHERQSMERWLVSLKGLW
jgi:hypothetical protein